MDKVVIHAHIGLAVAVLTAHATVRLSLRRFHSERWWEKKLEAYLDIFDALHHSKRYLARLLSEIEDGGSLAGDFRSKLAEKHMEASARLEKAADMGFFIVSPSVSDALKSLQERPSRGLSDGDWYSFFSEEYSATSETLEKVKGLRIQILKGKQQSESGQMAGGDSASQNANA